MSQRIGYRQELANRYLEYMRQAEVADQPKAQLSATPDQETVHEASRDGLAYRVRAMLKPSLKNQLDAAFMQGRAQREQDLGAAEIERRESPASGIAPMVAEWVFAVHFESPTPTKPNPRDCSRENCQAQRIMKRLLTTMKQWSHAGRRSTQRQCSTRCRPKSTFPPMHRSSIRWVSKYQRQWVEKTSPTLPRIQPAAEVTRTDVVLMRPIVRSVAPMSTVLRPRLAKEVDCRPRPN